MPLSNEQIAFRAQLDGVSKPLAIWAGEQMLGGRTLDNIKEQIRAVVGLVGSAREDGKIIVMAPREVPMDAITNALIGMFEGGYSPWLRRVSNVTPEVVAKERPAYADVTFWQNGGAYEFSHEDPEDVERETTMRVSLSEIISGLEKMAVRSPKHMADLIDENDDAITHDVLGQMIVYGEIVYG